MGMSGTGRNEPMPQGAPQNNFVPRFTRAGPSFQPQQNNAYPQAPINGQFTPGQVLNRTPRYPSFLPPAPPMGAAIQSSAPDYGMNFYAGFLPRPPTNRG